VTLRLDVSALDYALIASHFLALLGIGAVAQLTIRPTSISCCRAVGLPAWITGLAFIAANLGRRR
jgi:SSS family solute:Na+ symporter